MKKKKKKTLFLSLFSPPTLNLSSSFFLLLHCLVSESDVGCFSLQLPVNQEIPRDENCIPKKPESETKRNFMRKIRLILSLRNT